MPVSERYPAAVTADGWETDQGGHKRVERTRTEHPRAYRDYVPVMPAS